MRGIPLAVVAAAALLGLGACAPHDPRAAAVLALSGDSARGGALYAQTCAHCHKRDAGWRSTLQIYGHDGFVSTLLDGVPHTRMPSFASWSDQQLADVHAYVRTARQ
jgi:mono/diheme cytochrome c family protein